MVALSLTIPWLFPAFGFWIASQITLAGPMITVPLCPADLLVQNPDGSVTFKNCPIPGGGTMSGSENVVQGPGFITLIASPLTIAGSLGNSTTSEQFTVGQVDYNFNPAGPGTLSASCSGTLDSIPNGGVGTTINENLTCFSIASTFDNNPASTDQFKAKLDGALPQNFGLGPKVVNGMYTPGDGTLYLGVIVGDLPFGEAFIFPGSLEATAAVPEPGTLKIVVLAITAMTFYRSRRRVRENRAPS